MAVLIDENFVTMSHVTVPIMHNDTIITLCTVHSIGIANVLKVEYFRSINSNLL